MEKIYIYNEINLVPGIMKYKILAIYNKYSKLLYLITDN
jgi:hypothetical protein